MKIIHNQTTFMLDKRSAVAIGKFDGVHIGHQKLINQLQKQKEKGMQTVIFTFDPSPAEYFAKLKGQDFLEWEITTKEEKRSLFEEFGVDVLVEFPLNEITAHIEPEVFVEQYLVEYLKAGYIVAGTDLSFGNKGRGNAELLREMSAQFDFQIEIVDKVCFRGLEISSTLIREKIANGEVDELIDLLGRPYSFQGIIQHGNHIGRTIGMPTINLAFEKRKLLPPFGVYYSEVVWNQHTYYGISNIGNKPTISDKEATGLETYIYDFDQNLYHQHIKVKLLKYVREELRFESLDKLKEQMELDLNGGRRFFGLS